VNQHDEKAPAAGRGFFVALVIASQRVARSAPDDKLRKAIHRSAIAEAWIASSLSLLAMTMGSKRRDVFQQRDHAEDDDDHPADLLGAAIDRQHVDQMENEAAASSCSGRMRVHRRAVARQPRSAPGRGPCAGKAAVRPAPPVSSMLTADCERPSWIAARAKLLRSSCHDSPQGIDIEDRHLQLH